jgi:hypothetical protein
MKRYIIKTAAVIVITALISSCSNKVLDIVPQGPPVAATFWKTSNDAIAAFNALYAPFNQYEEFYGRGYMWYIDAGPDMVVGRSNADASNIKNFNPGTVTAGYAQEQWKMRYLVIRRANDIMKHLPGMDIDVSLKNRILGAAYFFSGLMYFELTYTYGDSQGGVPIVDTSETVAGDYYIPRAENAKANYDYIEGLWKRAAELLPYFEELDPADYGSPHKVAAWAYMAKMLLYEKEYAQSEVYADSVIQFGQRQLEPHFKDAFTIAENWGPEYIWSVVSSVQGGSELPGVMLENKGWGKYNGWGYFQPTKELYDAYEPGDERRAATILKKGDHFTYFGEDMVYESSNSLTGYQFNKYMEPFSYPDLQHVNPDGNFPTTDLNVPLFRYADLLLIKAEDELMQGKSGDKEINLIRNRAGLPSIHGATMTDLKRERRCELAGEYANTYFDLVRWGDAKTECSKPLHGADGQEVWPARNFDPSYMNVWPVPQAEIDNSGGVIKQSPGW